MTENKEKKVTLVEVVKDTELKYQLPDGENVDIEQYLVWMGNEILKLGKALG